MPATRPTPFPHAACPRCITCICVVCTTLKSIDVCLASSAEPGEILALRRTMHIAASHSSVVQVR
jgi:hypothetical protein